MNRSTMFNFLVVCICLSLADLLFGQVPPQLMNQQGNLIDTTTGLPVADATYEMVFSIYDGASGGAGLWTESHMVTTRNGLYSVILGTTRPITPAVLDGAERFLGIKVGTDAEMVPRKRLVSVAYALVSGTVVNGSPWSISGNNIFYNEGNVGIGTPAPADKLHVEGGGLRVVHTAGPFLHMRRDGNNEWFFNVDGTDNQLEFITGNLGAPPRMVITTSGNVGIGTTDATEALDVVGNIKSSSKILASAYSSTSPLILEAPAGTERFRIDDVTGYVGIGTTNPQAPLHILGPTISIPSFSPSIFVRANSSEQTLSMGLLLDNRDNAWIQSNGSLLIQPGNGNVGLGTSNPLAKLHIKTNNSTAPNYVRIEADNLQNAGLELVSTNFEGNPNYIFNDGDTGYLKFFVNGSNRMVIDQTGRVGIGTTSPIWTLDVRGPIGNAATIYHSDRRWKKNIRDLSGALDDVIKLRGVNYEWRRDDFEDMNFLEGRKVGFIAQEVEQVLPDLVNTDPNGYKGLEYAKLTAVLVEAIKELKLQNDELHERISVLEKTLAMK